MHGIIMIQNHLIHGEEHRTFIIIGNQEIETLNEKIGVSKRISSFTIPLGATINMDGTAIMQGVAVIFVAQAFGINLDFMDYITVIATATMTSIGTAAVPGVGLITLSMVFASVGLPVEGIALIMGQDGRLRLYWYLSSMPCLQHPDVPSDIHG